MSHVLLDALHQKDAYIVQNCFATITTYEKRVSKRDVNEKWY